MTNGTKDNEAMPYRKASEIDSSKDGVLYINMYSNCVTRLGRKLSHFAKTPFVHPYFGPFESMEGFWFYMRTGKSHDSLRYLYGIKAKIEGKELAVVHNPYFKEDILAGNYQKIIQDEGLMSSFKASTLPLTHFYLFRQKSDTEKVLKPVVVFPKNSDWLIDGMEAIRSSLKACEVPECWTNASKRYVSDATDR
jgi:hypothetical protein